VLSGKVFNKVVQFLSVPGIRDTQCGFKLFTSRSAGRIFSVARVDGFGFDVETLFLARKLGYHIGEIPVRWSNSPATKVSVFRDTLPMLWEVIRVRLYDWTKHYDRPPQK
jgi:dolichyl-phosphate beta-glucosyltransferase